MTLPVSHGLFTVLLGDRALSNMIPISATVFTNTDVHLRIWFSDGTVPYQQLAPDQRVASVGYAMMANSVTDGSITSAKLADGTISLSKLAPDVRTSLAGALISEDPNATNLLALGYTRIGDAQISTEGWQTTFTKNPATGRGGGSVIWTGTEIIMWGGSEIYTGGLTNDGGRYSVASNVWTRTRIQNAPSPRDSHTAVWTGTKMIIWGGTHYSPEGGSTNPISGAVYNPTSDSWSAMNENDAPKGRSRHSAVWTGTEMMVWGGQAAGGPQLNSGARFNPTSNSWRAISQADAPPSRSDHKAAWTGTQMLVWGSSPFSDIWLYDPADDSWSSASTINAPQIQSSGIWTGGELIFWNGNSPSSSGRYNPSSDTWSPINNSGPPYATFVVWAGSEAYALQNLYGTPIGGRYNPGSDSWAPISISDNPITYSASYFWTGNELLGFDPSFPSLIVRYSRPHSFYFYTRP